MTENEDPERLSPNPPLVPRLEAEEGIWGAHSTILIY
jgi:hypothetical protein